MSANYAAGLSPCDSRGVCGRPEIFDSSQESAEKTKQLADWIRGSRHCVLLIGAGISTASGIPDFRGPNGIWTIEEREKKSAKKQKTSHNQKTENKESIPEAIVKTEAPAPKSHVSLDDAQPTLTHLVIKSLVENKFVKYVISQNVDGLFLKTGIERKFLSEVHGNFFVDECNSCLSRFIRRTASPTMAQKVSDTPCPRRGRPCRGFLRDTILDWEDPLPESELRSAEQHVLKSDLVICLGTTLQINPVGSLPFYRRNEKPVESRRKVVIVNLQQTRFHKRADLVIHDYVDHVCKMLCEHLHVQPSLANDFTKFPEGTVRPWT
jgi:mono-ADP-ribosyltransferase sirtuin 6